MQNEPAKQITMPSFIQKTFGGLSKEYYYRHLFFGLVLASLNIYMGSKNPDGLPIGMMIFFLISMFLYPYARFVYESVMNYVVGENFFVFPAIVMLVMKIITMMMCYVFAIFIAPLGLAYLYYHTKNNPAE